MPLLGAGRTPQMRSVLRGRLRVRTALVVLVFIGGAAWLFSPVIAGKYLSASSAPSFQPPFAAHRPPSVPRPQHALNDLSFILEPYLFHAREAIRSGSLPLWDPHVDAGRPLGSAQSAPFYPPNW